jgi:4-carboxymuconolactone decarboxylase
MTNETYELGLRVRREVVGAEYVERALAQADEFTGPLQDLITEYAWGRVWSRDGLPRKVRSLVNLAMLVALNRPDELRLHVAGALRNDCSVEEIREVLLQTAIYCGVPAALDAFRVAQQTIAEYTEAESGPSAGPQTVPGSSQRKEERP